jgi:endogenous inhibitor of DNA gyrase (YacG/DUF329 family)
MSTTKTSSCPICSKPRVERYRPFCSKRCADIDLGRWLKGNYVIPADATNDTVSSDSERDISPKS